MRTLTRLGFSATAMVVVAASTVTLEAGTASANSPVPINSVLRRCDFSAVQTWTQVLRTSAGRGVANIHTSGSTVVADVNMVISNSPGAHYDIGLIQMPRPSSETCGPGDPGTTFTGLDTDGAGVANVTITAPLRQGATGVWVFVASPHPNNQAPAEFYTSEYVSPV
ncbi:hypothetical protein [Mycobacterium asiaticum]|uniref:Uncharacterized protein n=1 Tax=Mycobacterium asiaticum TaxID=1790 RepID=A0A1A3KWT1_MYCAS|nr:hypothetical protein [Mycobacterium asiaticum]OBJ47332.1 hypothetical protein A9W94_06020 [Mycobacterium asiaticum]OBJ89672.1 hypothetical protein A5640_26965 [Mycobacterium asiaticum]ORA17422.1 hypothetical protein BST16_03755 [Mycobacterium asiaticum DSM 44297]